MPIQRRSAPTLEGVARQIKAFEIRYNMDTEAFLEQGCDGSAVDEDDAMQWEYLHEQLVVLREAAVETLYAAQLEGRETLLQNVDTAPELLAA
jgi:hypothetical protein